MRIYITEGPQAVDTSKYDDINFKDRVVGNSTPSKDKINPSLLADIDKAAEIAGTKASVTTAVTGHRPGSRHELGLAVDLAMFDGKGYGSKEDAKKKGIYDKIEKFVKALEGMGYKVNSESGNDKAVLWFGFPNHHHHVHVSRKSDDGTSSSSSSDTEVTTTTTTSPSVIASTDKSTDSSSKGLFDLNTIGLLSSIGRMSESKKIRSMNKLLTEIEKINTINKNYLSENVVQTYQNTISFTNTQLAQNINPNLLKDINDVLSSKGYKGTLAPNQSDVNKVSINTSNNTNSTNNADFAQQLNLKFGYVPNDKLKEKYYIVLPDNKGVEVVNKTRAEQGQTTTTTTVKGGGPTTTTTTVQGGSSTSQTPTTVDTKSPEGAASDLYKNFMGTFTKAFATENTEVKKEKLLKEIDWIKKNMK
jgi:hypothetical protein